MMPLHLRGALAALVIVGALPGCVTSASDPVQTAPVPSRAEALDAAARARADSAQHPYTEADVRFMTSMIDHHAQALLISRWAPTHGASPTIRTLAARIINGQRDEIATMQQWLRDRRQPVPEPDTTGATMPAHGQGHQMTHDSSMHGARHGMKHDSATHAAHHPPAAGAAAHGAGHGMKHDSATHAAHHPPAAGGRGHTMPGMLTPAQLAQLHSARGPEFDRLFLTLMIQHHRGAVTMVEELFATYGAAQDEGVFRFATDVNVDQITEINRMERMLRSMIFEAPAP